MQFNFSSSLLSTNNAEVLEGGGIICACSEMFVQVPQ